MRISSMPIIRTLAAIWSDAESRALIVLAVVQIAIGSGVFMLLEGWSPIEALYFCVVTSTTVGYGDLTPDTDVGRLATILYIVLSVGLIGALLSRIASGRAERRATAIERRSGTSVEPSPDA
jgi:voltage-gated potassium channel Kch